MRSFLPGAWGVIVYLPDLLPYQQNDRHCNKDYDEPFCRVHRERAYPPQAQHKEHQGKHKENDRKLD